LRVNPLADESIMNEQLSFGCHLGDVCHLLTLAKQLEIDVIGIRFEFLNYPFSFQLTAITVGGYRAFQRPQDEPQTLRRQI